MKITKLPHPAKHSLVAFLIFLAVVLIGRHLVADQQQETRIERLETQIEQLEAKQKLYSERLAELKETAQPATNNHPTPPSNKRQTSATSKTAASTNVTSSTSAANTPAANSQTDNNNPIDRIASKLTEDTKSEKFKTPIRLELNAVDSATLVRVPGIAAKTASTIIAYRTRLGGFYSPEQLRERLTWDAAQEHMDEWCEKWFEADESLVQMLHINTLSFKELNRHPYINYEQTKAIVRYREKHKGIRSMAELEQLEEFDAETLSKLKHYISFD